MSFFTDNKNGDSASNCCTAKVLVLSAKGFAVSFDLGNFVCGVTWVLYLGTQVELHWSCGTTRRSYFRLVCQELVDYWDFLCREKQKVAAQWTCVTFLIPHPRNTQRYGKFLFHSLLTIKFMHAKHSWKTFQAIFGNILKVLKFVSHMEKYEKMRVLTLKI